MSRPEPDHEVTTQYLHLIQAGDAGIRSNLIDFTNPYET